MSNGRGHTYGTTVINIISAYIRSLILKHINRGIEELKKKKNDPNAVREASVLEKLLKIDRHVAVVMAMDMLLAGIDTVNSIQL